MISRSTFALLGIALFVHVIGCAKDKPIAKKRDAAATASKARQPEVRDAGMDAAVVTTPPRPTIAQVTVGKGHVCALTDRGAVHCWGSGQYGQLGYGNTDNIGDDELASVGGAVALGGTATQIEAGYRHTCALLSTGAVRCWGKNHRGQLGYGHTDNIGDDETPASAGDVPMGGTAVQISLGSNKACALLKDGAVRCWGFEVGIKGTTLTRQHIGDDETAADNPAVPLGAKATALAIGQFHQCALLPGKRVGCWRDPDEYDETIRRPIGKLPNVSLGGPVRTLEAGSSAVCALLESGGLRCWGEGERGFLGYPAHQFVGIDHNFAALGDVQIGDQVQEVAIGSDHMCGLLPEGRVRCWGSAHLGVLGYGDKRDIGDDETPAQAGYVDIGEPVVHLAANGYNTCALLGRGTVRCWGHGKYGQLGHGNTDTIGDDETPASTGDVPIF